MSEPNSPKELSTTDNNDILETPKRKLTPQKFILPIDMENSVAPPPENKAKENEKTKLEKLRSEKVEILSVMVTVKRKIADIEIQEEELLREVITKNIAE